MQLKTYRSGDRIIRQGDVGDCFYMILSGRVSVSQSSLTGGTVELVKLGAGESIPALFERREFNALYPHR
jgi:CRP-like cAMP-binding protein